MQVLVMCTANICRSPMAERMLRRHAEVRGADATITSAGMLEGGRRASDGSCRVVTDLGLDLEDHVSRRIEGEMIGAADLVLGMEARHVREAVVLAPERLHRIYTVRELAERGEQIGPIGSRPIDEWLVEVSAGRTGATQLGSTDLDVADPYGGPDEGYDRTGAELAELTGTIADLLWGPAPDDVAVFTVADAPTVTDKRTRLGPWFARG